jgi:hypothetical protein
MVVHYGGLESCDGGKDGQGNETKLTERKFTTIAQHISFQRNSKLAEIEKNRTGGL